MGLQAQCLSAGCLGPGTRLAHASAAASGNSQVALCPFSVSNDLQRPTPA